MACCIQLRKNIKYLCVIRRKALHMESLEKHGHAVPKATVKNEKALSRISAYVHCTLCCMQSEKLPWLSSLFTGKGMSIIRVVRKDRGSLSSWWRRRSPRTMLNPNILHVCGWTVDFTAVDKMYNSRSTSYHQAKKNSTVSMFFFLHQFPSFAAKEKCFLECF